MKIKDLLDFNPEAEIKIIQPNYISWAGELDYGWSTSRGDEANSSKMNATEVCIFMGNLSENIAQS